MTNTEKIAKILSWQSCGFVHPLTCNGGVLPREHQKDHTVDLMPEEREGEVVLVCPSCGRIQDWVPEVVYQYDASSHPLAQRKS